MPSSVFAVPVLADKVEGWKQWVKDNSGKMAEFNKRHGLTRQQVWLQQNPDGNYIAIIVLEGEGASSMMEKFATSEHPFDVEFRNKVGDAHGIDFSQPPPPPNECVLDSGQ